MARSYEIAEIGLARSVFPGEDERTFTVCLMIVDTVQLYGEPYDLVEIGFFLYRYGITREDFFFFKNPLRYGLFMLSKEPH